MAKQSIRIDNIALWRSVKNLADDKCDVKVAPAGLDYLPVGSQVYVRSDKPMYRFVKNYYAGEGELKVKFSLFVRSFDDRIGTITPQLDAIAETITISRAKSIIDNIDKMYFEYLDKFIDHEFEPEQVVNEETEDLPSDDEEAVENASNGENDTEINDNEQDEEIEEAIEEAEQVADDPDAEDYEDVEEIVEEIENEDTQEKEEQ